MSENPPEQASSEPTPQATSPRDQGPAVPTGGDRAGAPVRLVAVILALILAFVAAVAVVTMLELGELTPCEDVTSINQLVDGECFDGTAAAKTRSQIFGWLGAGFAALSIVAALGLAMT